MGARHRNHVNDYIVMLDKCENTRYWVTRPQGEYVANFLEEMLE